MTHVMITDMAKNSLTKGQEIAVPATVIECPPLKIIGLRTYQQGNYGPVAKKDHIIATDKFVGRRLKTKASGLPEQLECDYATLLVSTQPHLTTTGQKAPHIFEINFGGKSEDLLAFVKANKEITVETALKSGVYVDAHIITKGKGVQGPVHRYGVGIRRHKSEKVKRGAVMGPEGYAKVTFEAPMPGKMGHHTRTEWNKQVIAVNTKETNVTPNGGFSHYGVVRNSSILLKGSVGGSKKSLVRLVLATRKDPKASEQPLAVASIHTESQQ